VTDDADVVLTVTGAAERAFAAACGPTPPTRPELAIILDTVRARAQLEGGALVEAADASARVVTGGLRAGFEWAHVECLAYLALIAAWRGEHRKAARLAHLAMTLNDRLAVPLPQVRSVSEAALAWVYVETDDRVRARRHAASATKATVSGAAMTVTQALLDSRLRRAHGDFRGARACLNDCRRRNRMSASWAARIADDQAVICALEGHRAVGADPDHRPAGAASALPSTLPEQVGRLLVEAHDRVRRGEEDEAVDSLGHALRLAAPERLRRPFREAPPDVRRLLRARRDVAQRHGWLDADRDRRGPAVSTTAPHPAAPGLLLPEPLTEKERVVLGHMAQLLTTEEIAGTMFVSVNTIRTHVRNILRKLGATRRNQAIRRARELGILEAQIS
jgi:LuxR family maltose regulon positive regulatory protein